MRSPALCCLRFQSTLPRRERQRGFRFSQSQNDFNPRSREGSDTTGGVVVGRGIISIHAPAKGATGIHPHVVRRRYNFNPRSREGSDSGCHISASVHYHFNPRSREGSDENYFATAARCTDFNPRSREGSDKPPLPIHDRA